jgi:hypothetical protein
MKFYRVTLTRTTLRLNRRTGAQDPQFKSDSFLLCLDDAAIPQGAAGRALDRFWARRYHAALARFLEAPRTQSVRVDKVEEAPKPGAPTKTKNLLLSKPRLPAKPPTAGQSNPESPASAR